MEAWFERRLSWVLASNPGPLPLPLLLLMFPEVSSQSSSWFKLVQAGSSWFKLVRTVGVNNENGPSNDRSSDWTLRNLIHRAWSYAIRTGAYLSCLINCFQVYIFVSRRGYTNAVKNFEERCNELTDHKTRIRERDELRWRKVAQPLSIFRTKCLMFRSVSRATRKGNQSPLLNRSIQEPNQDNSLLPRIRQLSTKVFSLFKWILC